MRVCWVRPVARCSFSVLHALYSVGLQLHLLRLLPVGQLPYKRCGGGICGRGDRL